MTISLLILVILIFDHFQLSSLFAFSSFYFPVNFPLSVKSGINGDEKKQKKKKGKKKFEGKDLPLTTRNR